MFVTVKYSQIRDAVHTVIPNQEKESINMLIPVFQHRILNIE